MNSDSILKVAEKSFEKNKTECNFYARAVAEKMKVPFPDGNADNIVQVLRTSPSWINLGKGKSKEATAKAEEGYFVVAGMGGKDTKKGKENKDPKKIIHGHLAVVVKGEESGKPLAYWGQHGGVGKKKTKITWSFNKTDLENVEYFYYSIKTKFDLEE